MAVLSTVKFAFKKYPLISNCFTYGCMCVAAEFSQQFVNKRLLNSTQPADEFDTDALKRYAVFGFTIGPNVLHFWYNWLDKKYVGTANKIILRKVLMDQFLITPILYILFYTSMSLMEGKSDIFAECTAKFLPTFQTSCLFWLPAQTINFKLIPPSLRIVYVGSCSFIWINILCWLKRKEI